MLKPILVIDQGTTSSRAIIFKQGAIVAVAQQEFEQYFPKAGWVEHDAMEIWQTVQQCCFEVLEKAQLHAADIAAIGVTNQRETVVAWDKATGLPVHNAIVWQDRRTADYCAKLKKSYCESQIQKKTGLLLDPYFSATKINWLLNNVPQVSNLVEKDNLAVGTIDTWLLWQLTQGRQHATDATNASRTMLYNIQTHQWDDELLSVFDIPKIILPEVKDSSANFGITELFGAPIPIASMIGDQQAALVGQACFEQGMVKSTYGTGCFMVANTGKTCLTSKHRLLSTIAYQVNGEVTYALEGSIFMAGAAVQWLRDKLGLVQTAQETEAIAKACEGTNGMYVIPAFTGLGAPHWKPDAKAALVGMTRDTGRAEIVTATLQSVAYQTYDLLIAMQNDGMVVNSLRVDGGMVANNWFLDFLADVLDVTVERPAIFETTALGAAYLAALQVGAYDSLDSIAKHWQCASSFHGDMPEQKRRELLGGWHRALDKFID